MLVIYCGLSWLFISLASADVWGGQLRAVVMVANAGLTGLSRKHKVKVGMGSMLSGGSSGCGPKDQPQLCEVCHL